MKDNVKSITFAKANSMKNWLKTAVKVMTKIKNYIRELGLGKAYYAIVVVSIGLLIAGVCIPPYGEIDRSILIGIAEIMIFGIDIPVAILAVMMKGGKLSVDIDDKKIEFESNGDEK